MLQVKIDDKLYELPLGELFKDRLSKYINDGIVEPDKLDDLHKYRVYDILFEFVAKAFTMIYGPMEDDNSFKSKSDAEKSFDLRRRIASVDDVQRFIFERGNVRKSTELIKKFLVELLEFDNNMRLKARNIRGRAK